MKYEELVPGPVYSIAGRDDLGGVIGYQDSNPIVCIFSKRRMNTSSLTKDTFETRGIIWSGLGRGPSKLIEGLNSKHMYIKGIFEGKDFESEYKEK